MSIRFDETDLYVDAFSTWATVEGKSGGRENAAIRLKSELAKFRKNAAVLAADVARSVPQLTDHSIEHLDALWTTASQIVGNEKPLNPLEAFVLGGTFLIHDLGNAICAFPNRIEDLKGPQWDDLVVKIYAREYGRRPSKKQVANPAPKIVEIVLLQRLRQEHANACVILASKGIQNSDSTSLPLIEDGEIRDQLGRLIGEIAASHHWPIDDVSNRLDKFASLTETPSDWTIDALRIACILRCADACQVDRRRALPLREAVFQPQGESAKHWLAQQRINLPVVLRDTKLLEFRSSQPFSIEQREAWQIAFELVAKNAHRELQQSNELLKRSKRSEFTVNGVAGSTSVADFSRYVETDGWVPVDVSVRITDVANVVDRFGGHSLYGENVSVPIRELLANAADAIRARRNVTTGGLGPTDGTILVRVFEADLEWYLEVVDDGIGMSKEVLTGPLLDFGCSFWTSDFVLREFPGLLASEFNPTGKFGIGFFSVFMIANSVAVTTHRYDQGQAEALTLELKKGQITPLLRKSSATEICHSGGTRVRLRLTKNPWADGGLFGATQTPSRESTLSSRVASIAPTIDVGIYVQVGSQKPKQAVVANDWLDLSFPKLWNRLCDGGGGRMRATVSESVTFDSKHGCLGRISFHEPDYTTKCAITVGGLNAGWLEGACAGVLLGNTDLMSRNSATPLINGEMLAGQLGNLNDAEPNIHDRPAVHLASMMRRMGVVPNKVPMFMTSESDAMTVESLSDWARQFKPGEEVYVNFTGTFEHDDGLGNSGTLNLYRKDIDFDLKPNVVLAPELENVSLFSKSELVPKPRKAVDSISMLSVVREIFANVWNVDVADIEPSWSELEIGDYFARESHDILLEVAVFKRPKRVESVSESPSFATE